MADVLDWASDATYTDGSEGGQTPTEDPGATYVAQGFKPDDDVPASFLNWAIKGLADKLKGAATIALSSVLKYSLGGVTTWAVPEQGLAALGAGASARIKYRFSYLRTTNATPTALDTYADLPADSACVVMGYVVARNKTTATESAGYFLRHAFENNGGTVAQVATVNLLAQEDDSNWAASVAASSPNINVNVTGELANNIDWFVFWMIVEFTAAT